MTAWEYKLLTSGVTEAALNKLGADGWEVCGVACGRVYSSVILKRGVEEGRIVQLLKDAEQRDQLTGGINRALTAAQARGMAESVRRQAGSLDESAGLPRGEMRGEYPGGF